MTALTLAVILGSVVALVYGRDALDEPHGAWGRTS